MRLAKLRLPLRFQILLPLAAVAIASLLAVGVFNARLATRETQAAIAGQLEGVVDVLASSNFPLTDAVLKQMNGLSGAEFVLVNKRDEVVSSSLASLAENVPRVGDQESATHNALGPQVTIGTASYFHSVLRLNRPWEDSENNVLHIMFPLNRYNEAWRSAFLPPLIVGILTIAAVTLVTHWIASRISNNLAALGSSVQQLAAGDFKPLPVPQRDDEVRDLTLAVNQTAVRLSEYERHVRQTEQMRTVAMLGAGLAHEMRNAATGCRLAIDLHAEGCPASSEDDSLTVARSQLQLMENRLQGFLQLGREPSDSDSQEFDLAALVDELVPLVLPAARHAGVTLQRRATDNEIPVRGRREAIAMVVINPLLNAIDAAQKNADSQELPEIAVVLDQDSEGFVELEVSDSGPGLNVELAEQLFQPFVTTKPEGVGLGLAVAQQVARAHSGSIRWLREGDRTCFRLRLPGVAPGMMAERNGKHA